MMQEIYLLPEDRAYAKKRIVALENMIQDLGADFTMRLLRVAKLGTIIRPLRRCATNSRCMGRSLVVSGHLFGYQL